MIEVLAGEQVTKSVATVLYAGKPESKILEQVHFIQISTFNIH
jgi:hypothetical protein